MGRPPKPIEQKRRTGNPGKRALPAATKLSAVPQYEPAPHELDAESTLAGVLELAQGWLAGTDALEVVILRETLEERAVVREAIVELGPMMAGDLRKQLRELDAQIVKLCSELGLNPTARSRLGLAEVKAASTLDKMRARAASSTPTSRS